MSMSALAQEQNSNREQTGMLTVVTETREPEEGNVLGSLGLSPTLFVAQLMNFLIVLLVLWKFAYRPLMKLMQERTARIEEGVQKAEDADRRVTELTKEREDVLREARREAKDLIE
ncbi:ATP synthase F0 subunit B, partial [Candidatus Uhrbacteria bacterium]|nr:ATP synthase F0 subunit B [Candidatus Uhrbacteria bacterium]